MTDALKPSPSLLCKLGSIAIHSEEMLSNKGHEFDLSALETVLRDTEVKIWLKSMQDMALIPVKR